MKNPNAIFINVNVRQGDRRAPAHVTRPSGAHHDHTLHAHHGPTHTWKVAPASARGKLFAITDHAGLITIRHDGNDKVIWQGERGSERGAHKTLSVLRSEIDNPKLEHELLVLARAGDPHTPQEHATPAPASGRRPSAQPDATPKTATPKAATPATPKAAPEAEKKPRAKKTATKKTAAKKTAAKKTAAKKTAANKPVEVAAHTRNPPSSKAPTPAAPPASKPKPAASPASKHGSQRSPIDDHQVMSDLLEAIKRDFPAEAAKIHAMMRAAWFNGAREEVLAWMKTNPAESIVAAYGAWVQAHQEQYRMLATKPAATPAKKTAAKKTAAKRTAAPVQQPTTQRSQRPLDDEKVMGDSLAGLERDDPANAAGWYATMRAAWFNGARELFGAWRQTNPAKPGRSIAQHYVAWTMAHPDKAREAAAKAA